MMRQIVKHHDITAQSGLCQCNLGKYMPAGKRKGSLGPPLVCLDLRTVRMSEL